jgi:hypothetical protein
MSLAAAPSSVRPLGLDQSRSANDQLHPPTVQLLADLDDFLASTTADKLATTAIIRHLDQSISSRTGRLPIAVSTSPPSR